MIPKDPVMLLSYINTQLRDYYPGLEEACSALSINQEELVQTLAGLDYEYDGESNQFR